MAKTNYNYSMENTHCIYTIRNTQNGKYYVGRTKNFESRKRQHFSNLKKGKHCNKRLQSSFNKWGEGCFVMVIETSGLSRSDAKELEQFALDEVCGTPQCYNLSDMADGGPSGPKSTKTIEAMRASFTNARRKKISERMSGENHPMHGKQGFWAGKKRPEHSEKMKGRFTGDDNPAKQADVREKMSKVARNRKPVTCPHCGLVGTTNMKRYHFDKCKKQV